MMRSAENEQSQVRGERSSRLRCVDQLQSDAAAIDLRSVFIKTGRYERID